MDHEEQQFPDGYPGMTLRFSIITLFLIVDSCDQGLSSNPECSGDTAGKGWQLAQKDTLNMMKFGLLHQIL